MSLKKLKEIEKKMMEATTEDLTAAKERLKKKYGKEDYKIIEAIELLSVKGFLVILSNTCTFNTITKNSIAFFDYIETKS